MIDETLMRSCHEQRVQEIEHDRLVRGFARQQFAAKNGRDLWERAMQRGTQLARMIPRVIASQRALRRLAPLSR